jgi:exodeoxyribonuclease VII small subunit
MKKKMTFEEAMNRLEEIAAVLEAGETSLEKSLELYEEGTSLIKFCQSQLEEVAKKVQQLTKTSENNFQFKPFEKHGSEDE